MKLMSTALAMFFFANTSFAKGGRKFVTNEMCRLQYQVEVAEDLSEAKVYNPLSDTTEIIPKVSGNDRQLHFKSENLDNLNGFPIYDISIINYIGGMTSTIEVRYSGVFDGCFLEELVSIN